MMIQFNIRIKCAFLFVLLLGGENFVSAANPEASAAPGEKSVPLFSGPAPASAPPHPEAVVTAPSMLTPLDLLSWTEQEDPHLKASTSKIVETEQQVGVAESAFYPSVELNGMNNVGFPGSVARGGYLPYVRGIAISPYRQGWVGGAVAYYNLLDFKRTHARDAAKHDVDSWTEEKKITKIQVYENALRVYFDCIISKTLTSIYKTLGDESAVVETQVGMFVRTGQRSIVDKYLS